MAWRQLILELRAAEVPAAEALLELAGAQAVSLEDLSDTPVLEPERNQTPLWPRVRLTALFSADLDTGALSGALEPMLPPDTEIVFRVLDDDDWMESGRSQIQPRCFGDKLWLTSADEAAHSRGPKQIRLFMGLAFGTGEHPTTALCLDWLASQPLEDRLVLDYGCGSGVLALAALELGAERAWAVDNDPQAVTACRRNAASNGFSESIWIGAPEELMASRFDVVAANILAAPLIDNAAEFAGMITSGGVIVLSGILARQAAEVRASFESDFRHFEIAELDGWCRISAVRR